FHAEMAEYHRPRQWLNAQHHFAIEKDAHRPGGLTDSDRNGLGLARDGGCGPVARAKSLAQCDALRRRVDVHARRDDDTITPHNERAIELSDFLDLFAHLAVPNVALFLAVAAEGIEILRPGHAQHTLGVTDDKERADRLALSAFAANLGRHVDDG